MCLVHLVWWLPGLGWRSGTGCNLWMAECDQDLQATLKDCRGEFSRGDL